MVKLKNYSKAFIVPYRQGEVMYKQDDSVYFFPNCKIYPVCKTSRRLARYKQWVTTWSNSRVASLAMLKTEASRLSELLLTTLGGEGGN